MPVDSMQAMLMTLVVISLLFASACYLGWRLFDKPRHALIWSGAFALAAGQYGLNLMQDRIPVYEVYWLAVNVVSSLLVFTAAAGHRVRLQLTTPLPLAFLVVAGLLLAQIVFTLLIPRIDIRVALAPAFACMAFLHVAWILHRYGPEPRLAQVAAASVYLLFGLAQGVAAGIALQLGNEPSQAQRDAYNLVNFALMPTFFVVTGITVIFLLGTDLATRLWHLAVTDSLTALSNRRGFMQASARLLAQAQRQRRALTLITADLDFFKKINDSFGHAVGDDALVHFSSTLAGVVRGEDVAGRVGGEEFAVLLLGDVKDAQQVVARLRDTLLQRPIYAGGKVMPLSASFGIAEWQGEQEVEGLMIRADRALYAAKAAGRDTVVLAPRDVDSDTLPTLA